MNPIAETALKAAVAGTVAFVLGTIFGGPVCGAACCKAAAAAASGS